MPKKNRLSGAEIRSVRSPRRFHGGLFSLSVSPAETAAGFACVVSKKVAVKAVDRNLIKRRVRAAIYGSLKQAQPGSYMFHAKKQAKDASYIEIEQDVRTLMEHARGA